MNSLDHIPLLCFLCKRAGRTAVGTITVAEFIEPWPNPDGGEDICARFAVSMCVDCQVIHWASEYRP